MIGKQLYVAIDRDEMPGVTILADCPYCGAKVYTFDCQECGADIMDAHEKLVEMSYDEITEMVKGWRVA